MSDDWTSKEIALLRSKALAGTLTEDECLLYEDYLSSREAGALDTSERTMANAPDRTAVTVALVLLCIGAVALVFWMFMDFFNGWSSTLEILDGFRDFFDPNHGVRYYNGHAIIEGELAEAILFR